MDTLTSKPPRKRYIPALDGIRTLAVAAVILYHLNPSLAPGGMQGVTIFFVLSGFLITHLLLIEFEETGDIDLKGFWQRRLRRLVPAIVAVIVVTAALCTGLNHVMLTKMRPDIIPSALFFNNWWQILNQQSYFNAIGDPSPLTHFWSLAIEMQFYLIWPIVLIATLRHGTPRRRISRVALALAVLSAAEMALLYNPAADPSRIYYGTDTRAFSLLLGAWLALIPHANPLAAVRSAFGTFTQRRTAPGTGAKSQRSPIERTGYALDALGAIGLAGIIALMVWSNGYSAFPYRGGILLASIFSLMLISACVKPGSRLGAMFSWAPLVWLGKRSYGIYLWHYPLLLLMNPANDVTVKPWWAHALQVLIVLAVSELSYRCIETPCRHGALAAFADRLLHNRRELPAWAKRNALALAPGVAVCLIAIGGLIFVPATSALSDEGAALLQGDETTRHDEAHSPSPDRSAGVDYPEGAYDITMVGDSVSLRAVDAFNATFPHGHIDAAVSRQFTAGVEVYRSIVDQGLAGRIAVFALGTNGPFTSSDIDELMNIAGPDRIVVFVNNRAARPWCEPNNQTFAEAADRYKNVRIVDWFGASSNRNVLFDGDGIHLSDLGVEEYVSLIDQEVRAFLPLHLDDGDDPRLLVAQRAVDSLKQLVQLDLKPITCA